MVETRRSRNAIKIRHGIKWSAEEEAKVYETMARVLVADARAAREVSRQAAPPAAGSAPEPENKAPRRSAT